MLEWISEESDPRLPALRSWFRLSVPQSHHLVYDLLGTGRDRIVSALIPFVFDVIEEEQARCCACGLQPPRYPCGLYCRGCFDAICEAEIARGVER